MLDVKFSTEIFKHLVIKLSGIIDNDDKEKPELTNNGFLEEVLEFALSDMYQGFCLHPCGKVVNGDN